jgi:hypothetical protein
MVNIKNVTIKNPYKYTEPGLEMLQTKQDNGEINVSLTGNKQQINRYLQDAPILSERLRTLKNIPHYRIINSTRIEIY